MRFSLMTSMIFLTLSCLVALLWRERMKTEYLEENAVLLQQEIGTFDPNLRGDMPYFLDSTQPDKELASVHAMAIAKHAKSQQKRLADETNELQTTTLFHLPVLQDGKRFAVFVPAGDLIRLEIFPGNVFTGTIDSAKDDNMFELSHPYAGQLPQGISIIEVAKAASLEPLSPEDNFALQPNPKPRPTHSWAVKINGEERCALTDTKSHFAGSQMVWLTSTRIDSGLFIPRHCNVYTFAGHPMKPDDDSLTFASFMGTMITGVDKAGHPQLKRDFLNFKLVRIKSTSLPTVDANSTNGKVN